MQSKLQSMYYKAIQCNIDNNMQCHIQTTHEKALLCNTIEKHQIFPSFLGSCSCTMRILFCSCICIIIIGY